MKKQQYIVFGLNRFGTSVARTLAAAGNEVVAVDQDADRVAQIADDVSYAVQVDVADEEVQARGGAPVTDQTVLAVFAGERLLHQRVATQIDLADGEVVGCAPVLIHAFDSFLGNRSVQLLPRGANNRTRHVYSCTPALCCAIVYFHSVLNLAKPCGSAERFIPNHLSILRARCDFLLFFCDCVRKCVVSVKK